MDAKPVAAKYRRNGFRPFPTTPGSKVPIKDTSLSKAHLLPFAPNANIALFAGSGNKLAVIDADDEKSQAAVSAKLAELGLYDWTTIVRTPRKKGRHFWVRIAVLPDWVKAYYRLNPDVGGGEFRLRFPAYVLAPWSSLSEGSYVFEQGGIDFFLEQPLIPFDDLSWLIKPDILEYDRSSGASSVSKPYFGKIAANPGFQYNANPPVIQLFSSLKNARKGDCIDKIDYKTGDAALGCFPSRSEAEAALVTGLVMAGWTFDQIYAAFEEESPAHYSEVPNRRRYLVSTYNNAVRYLKLRMLARA